MIGERLDAERAMVTGAVPGVTGPGAIDTREIAPGAIFFALPGTRTDGHAYVEEAFRRGASAAVVRLDWTAPPHVPAERLIRVPDPRAALAGFARAHRDRLRARVIGVTGSVGKTTTKELLRRILGVRSPRSVRGMEGSRVTASVKSFNNDLGVPLTILAAGLDSDVIIAEMGANARGEIAALAEIARPDWAVITAIAEAHLEGFGDIDGVVRAKGEILDALPDDGIAFLNRGSPGFADLSRRARGRRVIEFGDGARDFAPLEVHAAGAKCVFRTAEGPALDVPLPARQVGNVLAAVAVARAMDLPWDAIAEGLRGFEPPPHRFRIDEVAGVTIVDDTYNASPISVKAAIEEVDALAASGRRYLVLGDMRELGDAAARLHAEVGEAILRSRFNDLVAVGSLAGIAADVVERCGRPAERFAGPEGIADVLAARIRTGDVVLLKGSRAVGLDAAARALRARLEGRAAGGEGA